MWASRRQETKVEKKAPIVIKYEAPREQAYELTPSQKFKGFVDGIYASVKRGAEDETTYQMLLKKLESVCDCFPVMDGYSHRNVEVALGSIVPKPNELWDIEADFQPQVIKSIETLYNFNGVESPALLRHAKKYWITSRKEARFQTNHAS
jgi:hypothetical protein